MAYTGPAENYDLEFRGLIVPPCATYEDTLVLIHGMKKEFAFDEVEDAMIALGAIYRRFGGGAETLPMAPDETEIRDYVMGPDSREPLRGTAGREEEMVSIVMRYLTGEGDDYEAMNELTN